MTETSLRVVVFGSVERRSLLSVEQFGSGRQRVPRSLSGTGCTAQFVSRGGKGDALKRLFLMLLPVAVLLGLVGVAPAYADEGVAYHAKRSWQDCQSLQYRGSRLLAVSTHTDYDGDGTYYVKWTLKWQVPGAVRWRERDRASGTGRKSASPMDVNMHR